MGSDHPNVLTGKTVAPYFGIVTHDDKDDAVVCLYSVLSYTTLRDTTLVNRFVKAAFLFAVQVEDYPVDPFVRHRNTSQALP